MSNLDTSTSPDLPHEVRIGGTVPYESPWLRLRIDDVRMPSGREGQRAVAERPSSAVIIPVTVDGSVLMIRQYRYAVDRTLIELPAGLVESGEDPWTTAARELKEETGYIASKLRVLATVYMSPGFTDEQTTFVLAEGCTPVAYTPDPDEPIRVMPVPLADIARLLDPEQPVVIQAQAMLGLLWLTNLSRGS